MNKSRKIAIIVSVFALAAILISGSVVFAQNTDTDKNICEGTNCQELCGDNCNGDCAGDCANGPDKGTCDGHAVSTDCGRICGKH